MRTVRQKTNIPPILIVACAIFALSKSQTCAVSQYFNGQRCGPCSPNCVCQAENTCDSCLSGFTFDALFQNCLQCPLAADSVNVGCKECCSQIYGPAFVCSSCPVGLDIYLIGGQCIRLSGCLNLSSYGVCTTCSGGYFLSQSFCLPCDTSCATCYDHTLCLTCKIGYFNSTDIHYSFCTACTVGCSACTSAVSCSTC